MSPEPAPAQGDPRPAATIPSESGARALLRAASAGFAVYVGTAVLAVLHVLPEGDVARLAAWLLGPVFMILAYLGRPPIMRSLAWAAAAFVAVSLLGLLLYGALGGHLPPDRDGTIAFGTGEPAAGGACTVGDPGTTFAPGTDLGAAATTLRVVQASEGVTLVVTVDGRPWMPPLTRSWGTGDCLTWRLPGSLLVPGSYEVELRMGSERLATGGFTVTP
jgi:hypothetical protein